MRVEGLPVDCSGVDCLLVDWLPVGKETPVECSVVDCHIERRETNLVVDCFVVHCRMGKPGKDLRVGCFKLSRYLEYCYETLF